jgi:hypothetical protein
VRIVQAPPDQQGGASDIMPQSLFTPETADLPIPSLTSLHCIPACALPVLQEYDVRIVQAPPDQQEARKWMHNLQLGLVSRLNQQAQVGSAGHKSGRGLRTGCLQMPSAACCPTAKGIQQDATLWGPMPRIITVYTVI